MPVLIDSDILIDAARGVSDAIAFLRDMEARETLAVSSITQMELLIGARNKAEVQSVERFTSRFQVIRLSEAISDVAVDLLRTYRLSHGLAIADALIAATAIVSNLAFATKNQRDYQFIASLVLQPHPYPAQ